jgi:hypothetical protein
MQRPCTGRFRTPLDLCVFPFPFPSSPVCCRWVGDWSEVCALVASRVRRSARLQGSDGTLAWVAHAQCINCPRVGLCVRCVVSAPAGLVAEGTLAKAAERAARTDADCRCTSQVTLTDRSAWGRSRARSDACVHWPTAQCQSTASGSDASVQLRAPCACLRSCWRSSSWLQQSAPRSSAVCEAPQPPELKDEADGEQRWGDACGAYVLLEHLAHTLFARVSSLRRC